MKNIMIIYKDGRNAQMSCNAYEHIGNFLYVHFDYGVDVFNLTAEVVSFTIQDIEAKSVFEVQEEK